MFLSSLKDDYISLCLRLFKLGASEEQEAYPLVVLLFFLYGFFEGFCFLDSLLRVSRDPSGNGRVKPLHYVARLHIFCYLVVIVLSINDLYH